MIKCMIALTRTKKGRPKGRMWSTGLTTPSSDIVIIVPGVAGLLRSAPLQFLHKHLTAPSQSFTDLSKGAAATKRPATILMKKHRTQR